MDAVTKEMVKLYKIKKIGLDFMGYRVDKTNNISFHHLIIPNRLGGKREISNGAILMQGQHRGESNSHDYLHLIEKLDYEIFCFITSEMLDQNIKGRLDIENLKQIRDLLQYFEREHINDRGNKGKRLIKPNYLVRPKLDTF